nr:unnamed protein product [Digitaria exilis]
MFISFSCSCTITGCHIFTNTTVLLPSSAQRFPISSREKGITSASFISAAAYAARFHPQKNPSREVPLSTAGLQIPQRRGFSTAPITSAHPRFLSSSASAATSPPHSSALASAGASGSGTFSLFSEGHAAGAGDGGHEGEGGGEEGSAGTASTAGGSGDFGRLCIGGCSGGGGEGVAAADALPRLPLSRRLEEGGVAGEEAAADSAALRCSSNASKAAWMRSCCGEHPHRVQKLPHPTVGGWPRRRRPPPPRACSGGGAVAASHPSRNERVTRWASTRWSSGVSPATRTRMAAGRRRNAAAMGSSAGDGWILPPLPGLGHSVFMAAAGPRAR